MCRDTKTAGAGVWLVREQIGGSYRQFAGAVLERVL